MVSNAISPLQQQMRDALLMRGRAKRTIESYIRSVEYLCRHYRRTPERISADQVQHWLLWLIKERGVSASTCHQYFNGVRFLYVFVLEDQAFSDYAFTLPSVAQRLPDLLSRSEVRRLIEAPRSGVHRLLLLSCYGCGLRVSELVRIQVQDINGERKLLHVVQSKGHQDRYVPIPESLLRQWRSYWAEHRPGRWLFPGRCAQRPRSITTVQKLYQRAKGDAGIDKQGAFMVCATPLPPMRYRRGCRSISCNGFWVIAI